MDKLIWEPGDPIQDLASRPRIRLRRRDEDFFRKHVQDRGGLAVLEAGVAPANDAQERIAENVKALRRLLDQKSPEERFALAKTIVLRTFLVIVSTPPRTPRRRTTTSPRRRRSTSPRSRCRTSR